MVLIVSQLPPFPDTLTQYLWRKKSISKSQLFPTDFSPETPIIFDIVWLLFGGGGGGRRSGRFYRAVTPVRLTMVIL